MKNNTFAGALGSFLLSTFLLTPAPVNAADASLTPIPSGDVLIGEQGCITTTFSNTGTPGFGPYFNITLSEKISLDSVSIIGIDLPFNQVGVIDGVTPVFDPISGIEIIANPVANVYQVVPPIGSVVENGPALELEICGTLQSSLQAGELQEVTITPGYKFGDTPTGVNGPIYEPIDQQTGVINPVILQMEKTNTAPESERPPGPSFPFDYHLLVNVAAGVTINNVQLTDAISPSLQWIGTPIVVDAPNGTNCTLDSSPNLAPFTGGTITVNCDSVSGSPADTDIEIIFSVYITDILDESANNPVQTITNLVSLNYDYLSTSYTDNSTDTVTARPLPLQKSASPALVLPGDDVNFSLNFQYTDYSDGGPVDVSTYTLTDVLPNGLEFNSGSANLTVAGVNIGTIAPTITPGPNPGETTLVFAINLQSGFSHGDVGNLSFTAKVVNYAGGGPVLAGDSFTNTASAEWTLSNGGSGIDTTSAGVSVENATLTKFISQPQPLPAFLNPGDTVTYRLVQQIPSGNIGQLIVTDSLPLPVFDVSTFNVNTDWQLVSPPPGLTLPSVSVDGPTNSVRFDFGTVDQPLGLTLTIDLTVTIVDTPFSDDLSLTNIVVAEHQNSIGESTSLVDTTGIKVAAPLLELTKGVLSADNPRASIVPLPGNPVSTAVDGDVSAVDGSDVIEFMLTLENTGNAPAYQVVIQDPAVSGLNCPLPAAADVKNGNGNQLAFSTLGATWADGIQLTNPLAKTDGTPGTSFSDDTALVIVRCTIDPQIQFSQVMDNTATANWAATASSSIKFPEITDSARITIASPTISKVISDITPGYTATPPYDTSARRAASIGERVSWRVELTLPEGRMNNVNFQDLLDNGLAFVENSLQISNPSGTVSTSIGGGFPAVITNNANYLNAGAAPLGVNRRLVVGPAQNDPGLGNITNSNTDNNQAETLIFEYDTIVLNWSSNVRNVERNNRADVNWDNPAGGRENTRGTGPNIRIREPGVVISKSLSVTSGDAGDNLTVSIDITHPSPANAPGFQLDLQDQLPSGMVFNGNLQLGTCANIPDGPLTENASVITAQWTSFPVGASCSFSFDAQIENIVNPGEVIQNCADITWQSLDDSDQSYLTGQNLWAVERTGLNTDPGELNNYNGQDCADFRIISVGLTKNITQTSQAHTGTNQHRPTAEDLTIGEEVTYRLVATLPEGIIPELIISDTVPFGASVLELLSASVINAGTNITLPGPAPTAVITDSQLGDGINDTATFDFGQNITVAVDGNPQGDNDRIFIQVKARVRNLPINLNSNDATNNGLVQFGSGLSGSASAAADLVEPRLSIHKSVDKTSSDAGDPLTYTVLIEHAPTSTADAFFVELEDIIPAALDFLGPLTLGSCTQAPTTGPSESGGTISVSWSSFPLGASCEFSFIASPNINVLPGQQITNVASSTWNSLDSLALPDNRSYTASSDVTVVVSQPGVVKDIVSTNNIDTASAEKGPAQDLTIGETAVYQITITFQDGTIPAVFIKDTLPGSTSVLEYVSSSIISIGADLSFSNLVSVGDSGDACLPDCDDNNDSLREIALWDLGTVVNQPDAISGTNPDDIMTLQVTAIVVDATTNSGTPGTDENQINLAEVITTQGTFSTLHHIDIVEPLLEIQKTALPANGQVVDGATPNLEYELIIRHQANSTADAYELTMSDTLNPNTFWVDDLLVTSDCPNFSLVTSPIAGQTGTVEFEISQLPKSVAQCSIKYTVDIDDLLPIAGSFPNTVELHWNSMPLPVTAGRESIDTATGLIISLADALITKTATSTSIVETGQGAGTDPGDTGRFDLAIGEQVVYDLVMTFNEGTTSNVVLDDLIQDDANGQMQILAATVTSIGADISTSAPGTVTGTLPGNAIMMDFGTVSNDTDVPGVQNDTITVQVVAQMLDDPTNVNDNNTLNTGTLNFQAGLNREDTEQINTVLPDIQMTKTMQPPVNNIVEVILQLENIGTAPAYDLVITDLFDETLYATLSGAEVSTPTGFVFSQSSSAGTTEIRFELHGDPLMPSAAQILMPGETMELRFEIEILGGDQPVSTSLDNTATTGYTSLPGPITGEGSYSTDATTNLKLPLMESIKEWSGPNNPATPGDVITYTITVNNTGEADASNVLVTDLPDPLGQFNTGSVASTASGVVQIGNAIGDTSVEVLVPLIPAQSNAIVTYTVGIPSPWPIEPQALTNQATVDTSELTPGVTDWPVDPGTTDPTLVDIVADPVLTLDKTDNGATAIPGQSLVYTLGYANTGNQNTAGVVITETVPQHTTYNAAASLPTMWTCADAAIAGTTCQTTVGGLDAGVNGTVHFGLTVVDPIPAGVNRIDNTASITDNGGQSDNGQPVTAQASDTTPIDGLPGLTINKSDGAIVVVPGQTYAYNLAYENVGEQDLTGVKLTETVPPYTTFSAAASSNGWSCADASPDGTICELTIGNLDAGVSGSLNFGLLVNFPLPSHVISTSNTVLIEDDGGSTSGILRSQSEDTTPIIAAPDLSIVKDDGGISNAQPGSVINYSLNWALAGNQNTEAVVVTETVPAGTTFSATNSLPDIWSCTDGAPSGASCELILGVLNVGSNGALNFAVVVDDPLPPGVNEAANTTRITDGGINGPDPTPDNNVSYIVTPLVLDPPVGRKSGQFDPGGSLVTWEMIWFNPNNTSDLPVLILDEIPQGTSFKSVDCQPSGTSSCSAVFNTTLKQIEITGIISPDYAAPPNASEDVLQNEIKITLVTGNLPGGKHTITNTAEGCWDYNNSGSADDDHADGQQCIPVSAAVLVAIPVPLFNNWTRALFILLLLMSGLVVLSKKNIRRHT